MLHLSFFFLDNLELEEEGAIFLWKSRNWMSSSTMS